MKKLMLILFAISIVLTSCKKSEEEDVYNPAEDGLVGQWQSSGSNVAALLVTYFGVDSIYANFNANKTYYVESFAQGVKVVYTGTYAQEKSGTGNIWNITLNQNAPTAVTSEGIFEITQTGSSYTMKYEVAQTTPNIGATAPTATGGFGSTSGGALGTANVQTFVQIAE